MTGEYLAMFLQIALAGNVPSDPCKKVMWLYENGYIEVIDRKLIIPIKGQKLKEALLMKAKEFHEIYT